ncbi:MAG: hypothetical protein EXR48_05705 [Dehalococcoidia bacterium]|nr:hypothetical protein [Dehalococcoidia bacterium]
MNLKNALAAIAPTVYSRSAGDQFVLLNIQNLRTLALDDVASHFWKRLQDQPNQQCGVQELINDCAPRGGAAAEIVAQRIQQLAQQQFLALTE